MANRLLTIDQITQEALLVLHQKLNFVTNIVTEYDDSFAQSGAKIGNTLRIRLPIQYNTGVGATIATGTASDTLENHVALTVSTQRHVAMRFTSAEQTMSIDDFRDRHLDPAMSKLSAMVESDALTMAAKASHLISAGTKVEYADVLDGRTKLINSLAPRDNLYALLDPQATVDLLVDNKALFNDQSELGKQFKEGRVGRQGGFDFFENTMIPSYTTGTGGGDNTYDVKLAQSGSYTTPNTMTLNIDQGTKVVTQGDVITIAGVYDVHPETKATLATLKQFAVVTAGAAGTTTGDTSIVISPAIVPTGPHKNASAAAPNDATITIAGAASTAYKRSLLFQKGFACFGTADLVLPPKEEASRQVYDGISLRIIKDYYDGIKDRLYTRVDILYGYQVLRPDLATQIWHT